MPTLSQLEEGFLAALVDQLPIGVAVLDADLRLVYINARQAAVNHLPIEEQIGCLIDDFIPTLAPVIRPLLLQVIHTGQPVIDQEVMSPQSESGNGLHRIVSYYPWRGEAGEVRGVIALIRDSETDPLIEHVMRASEQRLLNVLNNLPIFVGVMSLDGTLLDVNRAPLQSAGVDITEVCGKKLWDCYWWAHDDALARHVQMLCRDAAMGNPTRFDVQVQKKTGERIWVDFMLAPLRNAAGMITHIIPSAIDIDQRHRSEMALRASEERYRSLVESSDDAIISKTLQGVITSWNPAATSLFGYKESEVLGQSVLCLFPAHRLTEENEILAKLARGERIRHYETERLHKNGHTLYLSVTISPIFDADGHIVGACKIARDISLEKSSREAREAALSEKTALLHEVHHRVKNNLQIVSSLLNLQARKSSSEVKEALAESQGRIKAMALVHQLLYEASNMASIHLNDYLRRLVLLMMSTYSTKENGIHIRFTPAEAPVLLDIQRTIPCALVVNELILNAIKHAFNEEMQPVILITLTTPISGKARVTVSDNGCGLPVGFAFDQGVTLGTQLIPMFVQQLGGQITVVDTAIGACFQIDFDEDGGVE